MIGRIRVKICGLTRVEDAALAVSLGADAVGFILWPGSPRAIAPDAAREIARALPPFATRVGVFVNTPPARVADLADVIGLDAVQLHGEENVRDYQATARRVIKVVGLENEEAVARAAAIPTEVTLLVDAVDPARRGGTGRVADWSRAAALAARRPIMLAGGLNADNVAAAIRRVRPWAVDVSSGVESQPGVKSADRLRAFFAAVAGVTSEDQ